MIPDEKELFDQVIAYFCNRYGLTLTNPYDDDYFELSTYSGEVVCSLNPRGYEFLTSLANLTSQLNRNSGRF